MKAANKTQTTNKSSSRGITQSEKQRYINEGLNLSTIVESRMTSNQLGDIVAEWSRIAAGA